MISAAEEDINIPFTPDSAKYWHFISDRVMGGVSDGQLTLEQDGEIFFARLTGNVSTKNNGGFIQFRAGILQKLDDSFRGIKLKVCGNNQNYFIHIRTSGSVLPWQYYDKEIFLQMNGMRLN